MSFKLGKNVINSIFPNPVKDRIQVEFEFIKEQILPYSIYDVNGIVVSKGTFAGHTGINYSSINTETFASGVYFLRLEGQTSLDLKRFVKF
ncbi:MAG: T9SS type A sorting domain-containing protein [Saprospiraceae bacterium]|nr:T9SS type A sorting domain-containing protein [Saprospiraceae bacterium]